MAEKMSTFGSYEQEFVSSGNLSRSTPPSVSIIIVTYNGRRFLDDCLSSLAFQTFQNFEVILVDNGSSDESVSFVRKKYPSVVIIENGVNLGFAGGTNTGIRVAKGEFILALNNDTIADPSFLEEIVRPMQADSHVGVCGSKMVFPDKRLNSTGICISRSGAAWDRGMFEDDRGQYDREEEVFGACAGAALYRKAMLDRIGLLDEDFFAYMEDVDLAYRARLAGWKCIYVPTARIVHYHGGTAGYKSDLAVYYGNRNGVWYVLKVFPASMLLMYLPWILGRSICVIPYYSLKGKTRAILKSKIDAVKGVGKMIRKRSGISRAVPDDEIRKWMAVWAKIPGK